MALDGTGAKQDLRRKYGHSFHSTYKHHAGNTEDASPMVG
jgi:hypothetical protein